MALTNFAEKWLEICDEAELKTGFDCSRFREATICIDNYQRSTKNIAVQNPHIFKLPSLVGRPWWKMNDFNEQLQITLKDFENNYDELLKEFQSQLPQTTFSSLSTAYLGTNDGWKGFLFYDEDANVNPIAATLFPKTAELLAKLRTDGFTLKVHYSLLKSGAKILVHCGGVNHELRMHFGLVIPDGDIGICVGGEKRSWANGQWCFFDDTFPHEVWNNTDKDRYIIHCRVQHPGLSDEERKLSYEINRLLNLVDI